MPSANDRDTGTLASFTIVAHPERRNAEIIIEIFFINPNSIFELSHLIS